MPAEVVERELDPAGPAAGRLSWPSTDLCSRNESGDECDWCDVRCWPARAPAFPHWSHHHAPLAPAACTALTALAAGATAPLTRSADPRRRGRRSTTSAQAASAAVTNPVTPGDFTGLGFDQCPRRPRPKMDAWLTASPYRAVGIYISGASRGCRDQPNLTPTWIAPSCPTAGGCCRSRSARRPRAARVPALRRRPRDQPERRPAATRPARDQGVAEAVKNAAAPPRSASCRAARSGTTSRATTSPTPLPRVVAVVPQRLGPAAARARLRLRRLLQRRLGHQDARRRPGQPARPVRPARPDLDRAVGRRGQHLDDLHPPDGWSPGGRMKQFQGGHNETWGGVTINIDRNYLDLTGSATAPRPRPVPVPVPVPTAAPESHCGGTRVELPGLLHAQAEVRPARPARSRCSACSRRRALRRQAERRLRPGDPQGRRRVDEVARLHAHPHLAPQELGRAARRPGPPGA